MPLCSRHHHDHDDLHSAHHPATTTRTPYACQGTLKRSPRLLGLCVSHAVAHHDIHAPRRWHTNEQRRPGMDHPLQWPTTTADPFQTGRTYVNYTNMPLGSGEYQQCKLPQPHALSGAPQLLATTSTFLPHHQHPCHPLRVSPTHLHTLCGAPQCRPLSLCPFHPIHVPATLSVFLPPTPHSGHPIHIPATPSTFRPPHPCLCHPIHVTPTLSALPPPSLCRPHPLCIALTLSVSPPCTSTPSVAPLNTPPPS
ncbi:hypothetical protein K439DRAFT_1612967 [Ramaria rubella]|nr:hypothetical protein K439DRAFT_1612967 [Ramaria rubella]